MKKLLLVLLLLFPVDRAWSDDIKFPYPDMDIKNVYQLDNGKTIYIEQTAVGSTIWKKDETAKELKLVKHVWFFDGIAFMVIRIIVLKYFAIFPLCPQASFKFLHCSCLINLTFSLGVNLDTFFKS